MYKAGLTTGVVQRGCLRRDKQNPMTRSSLVYGGFHSHESTLKWLVYVKGNPSIKWMITRGTPILGHHHIDVQLQS